MKTINLFILKMPKNSIEINKTHDWHTVSADKLFLMLNSMSSGLTGDQVERRREEYGDNSLPKQKHPGVVVIFLHQFMSPLIYILFAAAVISMIIGDFKDAIFIFAVILLNAALGTFQEWKAEKNASALQNMLKTITVVKRGGHEIEIAAEELVPGDIVMLESGNKVPADIRILSVKNLQADEALLTGESLPVGKTDILLDKSVEIIERNNMLFAGTTINSGRCTGIVVETGIRTEVGKIAASVTKSKMTKPPLVIRMEKFSSNISYIVLASCLLLAGVALARGIPYGEVFFLAVALAVSAIPEGLPVALTVALSIATNRMAKRNVIVRKLAAVESLGSCTCIASDKTGTLTHNKQTAKTIWLPSHERFDLTGEGYEGVGEVLFSTGDNVKAEAEKQLHEIAVASAICNEATLEKEDGKWKHHGDTVDIALLAMGYKIGVNTHALRNKYDIIGEIPFESEIRFSAKFYHNGHGNEVAVKGALETILKHCDTMMVDGKHSPINISDIEKAGVMLAEEGFRVIAVAHGKVGKNWPGSDIKDKSLGEDDLPPLTLLGLVGMIDPLRVEVKDAIEKCRQAGICVVMVTGDHPATALAIARELGIANGENDIVTGKRLDEAGSSDMPAFIEAVRYGKVFARVTPLQKMEIVGALMKLGHFVAVTGDGINDSPALRKANIGVAMGSGTDVTKDTASIIITDDNFVSIVAGVEEGRHAYNNVRKVIYLLISQGAAEIALFTLALFAGLPMPLLAVQLLWLNLATNGIQDVALAFEGGEKEVMKSPPRKPKENIFNPLMLKQTIIAGSTMATVAFVTWYILLREGFSEFEARNILLFMMVLMENVHAFNARSETVSAFKIPIRNNILLVFGVIVAQSLHVISTYVPFMQDTLKIAPVSLGQWLIMIPFALSVLVAMEIFKKLRKKDERATIKSA